PPERLAAVSSRATSGTPAEIAALPEPVHTAVITGFAEAMQTAFLAAVPFVVIGFLVVLFLRETALRQRPTAQAYDGAVTDVAYRDDDPAQPASGPDVVPTDSGADGAAGRSPKRSS
ncbi:MAG: hypothetical protein ACRDTA_00495, partial [Pseudonocardiaceae bacterium]